MTPSTLQTDFKPRILSQLDEVADLRPGWDGAGAPPPRADILAAVRQWVNRLPDRAAVGPGGPTIRSTGISSTPPEERPSSPAARSTGSIERRRWARPVRTVRRERRNARARAASKS